MITDRKIYVMQRIQQAVVKGICTRYLVIELEEFPKVEQLISKFNLRYEAGMSSSTKARRRAGGEASTTLYVYRRLEKRKASQARFWMVLLVSDGLGKVVEEENLISVRDTRRRLSLDGYELVNDGKGWSWRMTKDMYQYWQVGIRRVCALAPEKRKDIPVQSLIKGLANTPGFRLARRQVGVLFAQFRAEWKRLRPATEPMPTLPTFLPYVRILPKTPKAKRASNG